MSTGRKEGQGKQQIIENLFIVWSDSGWPTYGVAMPARWGRTPAGGGQKTVRPGWSRG